ncbi:MAG: HNH endonuclease [Acidobacteriaceae bacterium]
MGYVRGIPYEFAQCHGNRERRPPSEIIEIRGVAYRTIWLTRGQFAVVDVESFERLNNLWYYAFYSRTLTGFYAARTVRVDGKNKTVFMHHDVLPAEPGMKVDHKDGNGLHNWRENLRQATQRENTWNSGLPSTNTSGFKGVYRHAENDCWCASIRVEGKTLYLGSRKKEADAAILYDEAVRKYRGGEFGWLNFKESETI